MKLNIISALLLLLFYGCTKEATKYRDYLQGEEKIYPGLPDKINAAPGNFRVRLSWLPSPDPSVSKYRIFWNNGADSTEVAANSHAPQDTVAVMVSGLVEYTYSFTVYSYDEAGNRSIPIEVNNIKVYGDSYRQSLTNRFLNTVKPYELVPGGIVLYFETPDAINTGTRIRFTATDGAVRTANIGPEESSIRLDGYKAGTKIYYQSGYVPVRAAVDTFYTAGPDSLANIISPLDKSLFAELRLPNDVGTYGSNTGLSNLWNGNTAPTGYPAIFHSDASTALPHHFTFDLGQVYEGLAQFEIIGRDCCNNPVRFEIWGINDLAGAATTTPSNAPGWKEESLAKGWKLLAEVNRADDGVAPFKTVLPDNTPAVRYIRIRVISVASGDAYYSNISEITFWKK